MMATHTSEGIGGRTPNVPPCTELGVYAKPFKYWLHRASCAYRLAREGEYLDFFETIS